MHLINTRTLLLHEFFGDKIPLYAILSHTWGDQEVSYQEWIYVHNQNVARWGWVRIESEVKATREKAGYVKIAHACKLARGLGHQWIWFDTNCIDKTSSAELSEAINSMYAWYRDSAVCLVYLADVSIAGSSHRSNTLQDLLAPIGLLFFSQHWSPLGNAHSLNPLLAEITAIDPTSDRINWLSRRGRLMAQVSIAARLSWASRRETTRFEDRAYCLLGFFGVNMPLLYGEGENAFARLQEEIIKRNPDSTIFV
ncbi:heterokaryon incompatibility protein-domain-containing protein [Lasiosphaeria miniovina]|uniref:Heterokaryon incompatibility protein-domain-containing protein n=1 Tax=Lasiosphaeria miniovina TaxID=1954250 RepID=A0AA40ATT4_9PEZI|nr:heterokaryon incompatibility protein-domain-containing protein [Lasiosphaeria miniovina]KAK0721891.1 heterokaryon incompatibility protein-domain-containing protein [Lasiosphaeria miniovina]